MTVRGGGRGSALFLRQPHDSIPNHDLHETPTRVEQRSILWYVNELGFEECHCVLLARGCQASTKVSRAVGIGNSH
jgi:hypothetical protein